MQDPESAGRAALRRGVLFYSTALAVDLIVLWYVAMSGPSGVGYVTLFIVGIVGLLIAYQVWNHLRDSGSPLVETEGEIVRKWSRADLLVTLFSFYIMIDRSVLRVSQQDYATVDAAMYVKVVHFPRTFQVVSVDVISPPPPTPD